MKTRQVYILLFSSTVIFLLLLKFTSFCESFYEYKVEIDGEIYPKLYSIFNDKSIDFAALNALPLKVVLIWNSHFNQQFDQSTCPIQNCVFTRDRTFLNHSQLVLVHMKDLFNKDHWTLANLPDPSGRPAFQRWVFSLYESPLWTPYNFTKFNGYFNFTSTYYSNSTYPGFYQHPGKAYPVKSIFF